MPTRICTICKEVKSHSEFYRRRNYSGVLVPQSICKLCCSGKRKCLTRTNIKFDKIPDIDGEIWKEFTDKHISYRVSNFGRIISPAIVGYRHNEIILKPSVSKKGYLMAHFVSGLKSIHRLVAKSFIPNPKNLPDVNHKDGNKKNNCVSNLEWCTNSENQLHAHRIGLVDNKGMKARRRLLNENQVREIYISDELHHVLGGRFGVDKSTIAKIKSGKNWGHFTKNIVI